MADTHPIHAPVPLVAIAGWLIPGAGYWLIGQRSRALATGITVIAIYLAGLMIGGVRVIEVPGYDERGRHVNVELVGSPQPVWILVGAPMQEIKSKPWSIAQVLAGPLGIASGFASVASAGIASISHTPVNEAGTLYTAVAGMLNLLAIIDAAHRAGAPEEDAS
jgi:hypothetical protein